MEKKSSVGTVLTLLGINAVFFAGAGVLTGYVSANIFAGLALLGCLSFLAGLTILSDQLSHQ